MPSLLVAVDLDTRSVVLIVLAMLVAPWPVFALAVGAIRRSRATRTYRRLWIPLVLLVGYCAFEGTVPRTGTHRIRDLSSSVESIYHLLLWIDFYLPIYPILVYLLLRYPTYVSDSPRTSKLKPLEILGILIGVVGIGAFIACFVPLGIGEATPAEKPWYLPTRTDTPGVGCMAAVSLLGAYWLVRIGRAIFVRRPS